MSSFGLYRANGRFLCASKISGVSKQPCLATLNIALVLGSGPGQCGHLLYDIFLIVTLAQDIEYIFEAS